MVAVSALEALAQHASQAVGSGQLIAAWMDARRGDVFASLYKVTSAPVFDADRLVELDAPTVASPIATLDRMAHRLTDTPVLFVGDGATLYSAPIERGWPLLSGTWPQPLLAGAIGRMALARAARGDTIHPSAVQPLYVRRPDAEVDRERRALDTRNTKDTKDTKDTKGRLV
jgi:tRNA A37 threonylcarbamoyladenosine modification protein TsaB